MNVIAWAGTICGMIGAFLISQNIGMNDVAYYIMLVGSAACLWDAIKQKQTPYIVMWAYFGACNINGIINYFK